MRSAPHAPDVRLQARQRGDIPRRDQGARAPRNLATPGVGVSNFETSRSLGIEWDVSGFRRAVTDVYARDSAQISARRGKDAEFRENA